jgi:general secretion pathway protein N
MPLQMPCSPSGRAIGLLTSLSLIAGAMFGVTRAWAANASLGSQTWNDDPDPGMKLETRPLVGPEPPPALESTPALESMQPPLPSPAAPSTPAARSVPEGPTQHGNPLWAVPLRLLHNTRERPLFSSSRRPPPPRDVAPPPVAAAAPPPPPPRPSRPDLSLVGTIISDRESIGVFMEDGTAKILRLRMGEGHEGWVLRQVELRKVTLDSDTDSAILTLPAPGTDPQHAIPSPYARGTRRVHH